MKQKNITINSDSYAYLKSLIGSLTVVDLYIKGKWLVAELSSGVRFSVRNDKILTPNG